MKLSLLAILLTTPFLQAAEKPNVILIMADDLGWGDTGYNGNKIIQTPHLDQMAKEGLQMDRFYSASAVCSPTRASCLTGRNPFRTGIFYANEGILRPEEITLPEILQKNGYMTGHFGKWHLGTVTIKEKDANRGDPNNTKEYNPPQLHGYDECFVTESKVPTYDPMKMPAKFTKGESRKLGWKPLEPGQESVHYGTHYWDIAGNKVTDNLEGDDSRVMMDRILPFIDKAVAAKKPFLSVVWFHTPHLPCVAGPKYQELYKDHPLEMRNYAGCVTAMDEQIGRLRKHLKDIGVDQNTMIWFCSDNGPEGKANGKNGTAGKYTGRKRSLNEGGVRVPGLLVWPAKIKQARKTSIPCVTSDYLPTILDAAGIAHPNSDIPLDGISLVPLINGEMKERKAPIGILIDSKLAFHQGDFKLLSDNGGKTIKLYDLSKDETEKNNIAAQYPEKVVSGMDLFKKWYASVQDSFEGKEYGKESYERMGQKWKNTYDPDKKEKGKRVKEKGKTMKK